MNRKEFLKTVGGGTLALSLAPNLVFASQKSILDKNAAYKLTVLHTNDQHGKQPRRWLITERGGKETERVHIHGIIFTDLDNDTILKSWKFGIADDGRSTGRKGWVNEQTINYKIGRANV